MSVSIKRYNASSGSLIGTVSNQLMSLRSEYRLFGGCYSADLSFVAPWGDDDVANEGDRLSVESGNIPVFDGRVVKVSPRLGGTQNIQIEGWWRRLDELDVVADPISDRITFGVSENSDHPTIKTAYQIVGWLLDNIIVPDPRSRITRGRIVAPTASCKVGEFAIYAADKLSTVLETLATMDDCVCGIDAEQEFYYIPRQDLVDDPELQARVAEAMPANWRTNGRVYAENGSFTTERRGPNVISVNSRDASAARGVRTYRYVAALDDTRRVGVYYVPQVRAGQGARRLARGLFRRFAKFGRKVENLSCVGGTRRFEPHLGAVSVYDGGELVVTDVAGSVSVEWIGSDVGSDSVRMTLTLGENKADPGSGNPLNDPFAPAGAQSVPDNPQIDTGDGETSEDYPIPSQNIDDDDGFDGDGDDLHTNPDRETPSDLPGDGIDGVDYGEDVADPTNGAGSGGGGERWLPGRVVSATGGADPRATIDELDEDDFATVVARHENVRVWPRLELSAGDEGWLQFEASLVPESFSP